MAHVFTVRELSQAIKDTLEGEFPFVWIQGQVGNVSRPASGHIYFTLKDEQACVDLVWFRSNQGGRLNTEPTALATGQEVLCAGRLSVYPQRGTYQVLAELVQEQGLGRLHREFEALKRSLAREGLFEPDTKKSLPANPTRVAVVTAPTGAALHDFLRLARDRGLGSQIRVYPCQVQGQAAEETVVSALEMADLEQWAQVIVLIRGGGSLEDLWTFNTEPVARTLAACSTPALTGIGHQVDTTIADLVADVRAATPSHAAQMVWPERSTLIQMLDELDQRLLRQWLARLTQAEHEVHQAQKALSWLSPGKHLQRRQERLQTLARSLSRHMHTLLSGKETRLYSVVPRLLRAGHPSGWSRQEERIHSLAARLLSSARSGVRSREHQLEQIQTRLSGLDPYQPLRRGYSLVRLSASGEIVRRADQVHPGDSLDITAQRTRLQATVHSIHPDLDTEDNSDYD